MSRSGSKFLAPSQERENPAWSPRSEDQSHIIEAIEREIRFVQGNSSTSRYNGPPTFARVDVSPFQGSSKQDTLSKGFSYRMNQSESERQVFHKIPGEDAVESSRLEEFKPDVHDTQYLISLGGLNLDPQSNRMNLSVENTTERLLDFSKRALNKVSDSNLIGEGPVHGQIGETDRASLTLVEELSQQIVRLNSANSALIHEVKRLKENAPLDKPLSIQSLEDRIKVLNRLNTELKSELDETKTETRMTMDNFKRYHEEMVQDLERKHKRVMKTLKDTYEKELDDMRKENTSFVLKIQKLEEILSQKEASLLAFTQTTVRSQIKFTKHDRSQSKSSSHFQIHSPSQNGANSPPEQDEPAQVIVSPKPASRSRDKKDECGGFYFEEDIDDFHTYLKETHEMGRESFGNPTMPTSIKNGKKLGTFEESFSLMLKSRENIDPNTDKIRNTKRSRVDSKGKKTDRAESSTLRDAEASKNKSKSRGKEIKNDPKLKIHKTASRALDIMHPFSLILNTSKSKSNLKQRITQKNPEPTTKGAKRLDRSASKTSKDRYSSKKRLQPPNLVKYSTESTYRRERRELQHQSSFLTNISIGQPSHHLL